MNNEFIPNISHIVCIDKMGLIGSDNKLIWDIPEELEYFKTITNDSIVIMGNSTFKSIKNKPLKNRINIIISKSLKVKDSLDLYIRNSIEDALILAEYLALKDLKHIFIIGGQSIYDKTFDIINKVYISVIDYNYYHSHLLKNISNLLYYDYSELLENGFVLTKKSRLNSTNFIHGIHTYEFTKDKNDKLE